MCAKKKPEIKPEEERRRIRVEHHFGGKHHTTYYSDGTCCNVYEDGYMSPSDYVVKLSPETETKNKMKTKTTNSAKKATKTDETSAKKPVAKLELIPTVETPKGPFPLIIKSKPSRADVATAVANFLKNPPEKPLTLEQVYETIGFAHRQVYLMVREHGVPVGKTDKVGKGRKETLFTFKQ
jgi:hypothetical protein